MARPITDEDRRRVRELHAAGKGRNAIARELRRSGQTVSKLAGELGLSFDRSETVAATEARKADAAALRAEEMLGALAAAKRLREELFAPCKAFNFGGKENTYNEVLLDQPTFEQQQKIAQSWALMVDKSMRLDLHDSDDQGLAAVDAWLRDVMGS